MCLMDESQFLCLIPAELLFWIFFFKLLILKKGFAGNWTCNNKVKRAQQNNFDVVFKVSMLYFVNIYSFFESFATPISNVWIRPL